MAEYAALKQAKPANKRETRKVSPMFFYVHNPDAWEVRNGRLIPALSRDNVDAGLHDIRGEYDRAGNLVGFNTAKYFADKANKGWKVVPHDVDSPDHPSYMLKVTDFCYVDRFTSVQAGGDRHRFDEEAYTEWAESLVLRGVLPKPNTFALDRMLRNAIRQAETMRTKAASLPPGAAAAFEVRAAQAEAEIAILKKELAEAEKREGSEENLPAEAAIPSLDGGKVKAPTRNYGKQA